MENRSRSIRLRIRTSGSERLLRREGSMVWESNRLVSFCDSAKFFGFSCRIYGSSCDLRLNRNGNHQKTRIGKSPDHVYHRQ